jgi:hypothetical protein
MATAFDAIMFQKNICLYDKQVVVTTEFVSVEDMENDLTSLLKNKEYNKAFPLWACLCKWHNLAVTGRIIPLD